MAYDMRGKRVYLSGPMSGYPDWNEPAFEDAKWACLLAGAEVAFNPCTAWGHHDRPRSWYMARDLHVLTMMDGERPWFDCVVLLPGWYASAGAQAEQLVAHECGIAQVNLREVLEQAGEVGE